MALGQMMIDQIHGLLKEKGLGDFEVKKLELAPKEDVVVASTPRIQAEQLVADLQRSLDQMESGHLRITTLEIGLRLSSDCGPDEVPMQVCETLPGGRIRCETKCVKRQATLSDVDLPKAHL